MSAEVPQFRGTERFEIIRVLGAGGMGVVYEVFDRDRAENVALKVLSRVDPNHLYMFKQEFRSLADVAHPNLVGLHEMLSDGEHWFFTMDLVAGVDFLSFVRGTAADLVASPALVATEVSSSSGSSLRPDESSGDDETVAVQSSDSEEWQSSGNRGDAAGMPAGPPLGNLGPDAEQRLRVAFRGLCIAVSGLHAAGKIHRDLKPSNVKVAPDGTVVLLDFGLVTDALLDAQGGDSGLVVGTLPYMSPEQAAGEKLTRASDWYSVGVMLYEALAGRVPFAGSVSKMLVAKRTAVPQPPRTQWPGVPNDLEDLCMAMLSADPALRPHGVESLGTLGTAAAVGTVKTGLNGGEVLARRAGSWTAGTRTAGVGDLIGRERQLLALANALGRCTGGAPVLVDVVGRSGAGKSVLVDRFLKDAAASGALVLAGRCYERESVPYKAVDPVVDALAGWLRTLPRAESEAFLPVHSRTLASMFPVLDRVTTLRELPERQGRTWDRRELRFLAFDALRDVLGRIARRRTLVIHVDDFHWGDRDSAKLLKELMRPPDPPPLLLMLSYRAEEAERSEAVGELTEGREAAGLRAEKIEVGPLTQEEATRLALSRLAPVPPEFAIQAAAIPAQSGPAARVAATPAESEPAARAVAIAAESEGIPYFVEELCRHFSDPRGHANTPGSSRVSLDDYVRTRAATLSPQAQTLLRIAAVAGAPIPIRIAVRASGVSSGTSKALSEVRAAHMLRAHGAPEDAAIECFHDRVREAVASGVEPEERKQLHARLAVELEAWGKATPDRLCLHFHEGGMSAKAGVYAKVAGDAASAALAFDRAATLYKTAIEDGEWSGPERLSLLVSLGDALANAGRGAAASAVYQQAAQASQEEEAWRLKIKAMEQLLKTGHVDEGTRALSDIGAQIGLRIPRSEAGTMMRVLTLRLRTRLRSLRYTLSPEAAVRPDLLRKTDVCWSVASGAGFFLPMLGMLFQARGLRAALDSGEPFRLLRALCLEAGYDAAFGGKGIRRSIKLHGMAEPLLTVATGPHARAIFLLTKAIARFQMGCWTECRDLATEAERICVADLPGASWELNTARLYRLAGTVYLGGIKAYFEEAELLFKDAQDRGDIHAVAHLRLGSPVHKGLLSSSPDLVREEVESVFAALPEHQLSMHWVYGTRALIQAKLFQGDGPGAVALAQEMVSRLRFSTLSSVLMVRTLAAELPAMAAICAAPTLPPAKVRSIVSKSVRDLNGQGVPHAIAFAHMLSAGLATVEGRSEDAADLYGTAAQQFSNHGMRFWMHAALWRRQEIAKRPALDPDRAAAVDYFRGEGVLDPERLIRTIAPGPCA